MAKERIGFSKEVNEHVQKLVQGEMDQYLSEKDHDEARPDGSGRNSTSQNLDRLASLHHDLSQKEGKS